MLPTKIRKKDYKVKINSQLFLLAMRNNFGQQVNNDITKTAPSQQNEETNHCLLNYPHF